MNVLGKFGEAFLTGCVIISSNLLHDLWAASKWSNQVNFLTTFATPGAATGLTIYNGLACVADGTAGVRYAQDSSHRHA